VMLRIYNIINGLKLFSYLEESFFDSIDNAGLDLSEFRKNVNDGGIFVEGNGNEFSNKQVIMYIRNAFNHNDDNVHSKFNISRNGKYIEVHLQDVRKEELKITNPNDKKPFHIKISYDNFVKLFNLMNRNIQNCYVSFYTSDLGPLNSECLEDEFLHRLCFNRIILQKKVPQEVLQEIIKISKNNPLPKDQKLLQINNILLTNGIRYKIESYPLDIYQKKAIRTLISKEKNFDTMVLDNLLIQAAKLYTPLGLEKHSNIIYELLLLKLMLNTDITYQEFIDSVYKYIDGEKEETNGLAKRLYEKGTGDLREKIELQVSVDLYMDKSPYLTYVTYVISNMYDTDSEIIINGINREHLRNSLTHGWYFVDRQNNLMLYDNFNRRKNDYDFYWHKSVPFVDLFNVIVGKNHTQIKVEGNKKK